MYYGPRLVLLGNTLSLVEWDTHHMLIYHSTLVTSTPIILFVEVLKFSQNTSFQEQYLVKEGRKCFGIFYFQHRIFKISFSDEWFIGVDLGSATIESHNIFLYKILVSNPFNAFLSTNAWTGDSLDMCFFNLFSFNTIFMSRFSIPSLSLCILFLFNQIWI